MRPTKANANATPSSKPTRPNIRDAAKENPILDSRAASIEYLCLLIPLGLPHEVAYAIANKPSSHPARKNEKEFEEEPDVRESRETFKELLDSYCTVVNASDTDKKTKKIKHLGNFEGLPIKFRDVLADEIWKTSNRLEAKRRNWNPGQDSGTKPSREDIKSLKNIYAKCSASIAQELGKKYLKQALKEAEESGLITVENKYFIEFSIHTPAIEKIIRENNQSEYEKIVRLVRCLLISNVQKAQGMWDAVRLNSHSTNREFNIAKEKLELHLENCVSKNSSWQDNSVLNRDFNTAWATFELDATKKPVLKPKLTHKRLQTQ